MPLESELDPIFARLPEWAGAEILAERIAGLTNANYRVTVNGEQFVLRVSGENTRQLGIDRRHEADALHNAAAQGLAPEVYALLLPEGHLVTRWVEGYHWGAAEFRTPENVRLLTGTVKRLHSLPPTGAVFSPFQRIEAYIQTARRFEVSFPADFDSALVAMRTVEVDQQRDPSDWQRFCHNDLVSVNYLYSARERRITVLDWEFAGWGDLYYDLATVVYTHDNVGPIPPDLEQVMLAEYFGAVTDWHHRRLNGMKYMVMLFSGMWGLAQHGMQSAGLIPPVEGFDYLEFAQYLFSHDILKLRQALRD